MSDLIRRDDAIRALHKHFSSGFDCDRWWNSTIVLFALNSVPSADRPQGEWFKDDEGTFICSACGSGYKDQPTLMGKPMFKWCPLCGARMKGADDE